MLLIFQCDICYYRITDQELIYLIKKHARVQPGDGQLITCKIAAKTCRECVAEGISVVSHETQHWENTIGCYGDLWTDGWLITYVDPLNEGLLLIVI